MRRSTIKYVDTTAPEIFSVKIDRAKKALGILHGEEAEFRKVFQAADLDNSGDVDFEELKVLLDKAGIGMDDGEFDAFVTVMDSDQNGRIDFQEFCDVFQMVKTKKQTLELDRLVQRHAVRPMPSVAELMAVGVKADVSFLFARINLKFF